MRSIETGEGCGASHDGKVNRRNHQPQKFLTALDLVTLASPICRSSHSGPDQIKKDKDMIKLSVPDMSCGHCVGVIEKAVKSVDAQAAVRADLAAKTVSIESSAPPAAISKAVDAAGYPNSNA
jgi:copper chaperone